MQSLIHEHRCEVVGGKVIWALALRGTAGWGIGQHGIDELRKGHRGKGRR